LTSFSLEYSRKLLAVLIGVSRAAELSERSAQRSLHMDPGVNFDQAFNVSRVFRKLHP
jgi:hypothetical protein